MDYLNTQQFLREVKKTFSNGKEDKNFPMSAEAKITYPFIVVEDDKEIGCIYLFSSPKMKQGWVDMMHFRVYEERKGYGSRLLSSLCTLADKHNILLFVFPVIDENSTLSLESLKLWYRKFGFLGDISMERKPKGQM